MRFLEILSLISIVCLTIDVLVYVPMVEADPEAKEYQTKAHRTSMKIEIDGKLDEPVWKEAEPIKQFVQVEPNEGEPITQPTEARILYDDKNIYFGFTCFTCDISKLIVNEMRRDSRGLWAGIFEEDVSEQNNAFYFGGNWRNDRFQLSSSYTDIGESFNPAVGFVRRTGIRRISGDVCYTPWPRGFESDIA